MDVNLKLSHKEFPVSIDSYDMFYFETRIRDMIAEYMDPVNEGMLKDTETVRAVRTEYENMFKRVQKRTSTASVQRTHRLDLPSYRYRYYW